MTADSTQTVVLIGEVSLRMVLRDILSAMGYTTFEADRVASLPSAVPSSPVLVVLLVEEPAFALTRTIRSLRLRWSQVPLVVMAPHVGWDLRQRAMANGVADVVSLTAPLSELQQRLLAAIGSPSP
jgi:DNA-binding response OmpR family regulator